MYLPEALALQDEIIRHRRTLHENPELSFQEYQTSEYIQRVLSELDIPFRVLAQTGVVAHIGSGERCVALRADIDALPIHEEADVEFRSKNDGVMHACGHDAHTAMLLGAAKILKQQEHNINGVVKLIFQLGEEKLPGGASIMIKEGALEDPTPEMIFGQHVYPGATAGKLLFVPGAMMAAADEIYWTIHGKSGHAAQPHLATDPIVASAYMITQLQTIMSREKNPFDSGVLTIGAIQGGSANNVIPDAVSMKGTLRSMDLEWREKAIAAIERHSTVSAEAFGATCDLEILRGYPPVINNEKATAFARTVAETMFSANEVGDFEPKMWGEDFAFYAQKIPACFWMLGVRPPSMESAPGLHNSKFIIDESALHRGTAMMVQTAIQFLENDR
jgi:hippurate hydrolase